MAAVSPPTVFTAMAEKIMHVDRRSLIALALLLAFVIALRLLSPSDLYDNDQPTPIAHVVDVAVNGDWLMQDDPTGKLITKPPMYPWLGAVAVKLTGRTDEWVVKLPMIAAFLVVTLIVFDLARRELGVSGGVAAAAFWAANYHTFKLLFTARTDMLLVMWMALALWAAERQRRRWISNLKSPIGLIALFWVGIAAGLLTKGPVALLPALWLVGAMAAHRQWRAARPVVQIFGFLAALAIPLWWLMSVMSAYPDWFDANFTREVTERISGQGSGSRRDTSPLAIPAYFLGRFAPWSVLFVVAAIATRNARRAAPVWALLWTLLILIFFTIPTGKRADYIVPAYVSASVLTAWLVMLSVEQQGWFREVTRFFLGGLALAGVAAGVACWWMPVPESMQFTFLTEGLTIHDHGPMLYRILIIFCGFAGLIAGVLGLIAGQRRHYDHAALAAAFVIAAILGIYQCSFSDAAKTRGGDYVLAVAEFVKDHANGEPVACYQISSAPVQALLGMNEPMDERALAKIARGGVLVTSLSAWDLIAPQLEDRATLLLLTPRLPSSKVELLVVRVR